MAGGTSSELTRRVLAAGVFVPVILALAWVGGWALFVLVALIVGRASWEFYYLAEAAGHRPARVAGVTICVGWCLYAFAADIGNLHLVLTGVAMVGLLAALRGGVQGYTANAAITLLGVVYVGVLGSLPLWIERDYGVDGTAGALICIVFLSVWLTDAAAYFGGRQWGERKLLPAVSPGKTRVGFVTGMLGGVLPLALHSLVPQLSWAELAGLLLLVAFGGQVGDLVESALKRDFGFKDAPGIIPGHGGFLDRFDSYLFAFPLTYFYLSTLSILHRYG